MRRKAERLLHRPSSDGPGKMITETLWRYSVTISLAGRYLNQKYRWAINNVIVFIDDIQTADIRALHNVKIC